MTTKLSAQAKTLMDSADSLHTALCARYGETAQVSLDIEMCGVTAFVAFCELEALETGEAEVE